MGAAGVVRDAGSVSLEQAQAQRCRWGTELKYKAGCAYGMRAAAPLRAPTLPTSLRPRSTSMTCSAISFWSASRSAWGKEGGLVVFKMISSGARNSTKSLSKNRYSLH